MKGLLDDKSSRSRDITVDIIKGIGLILMVMGHCGFAYTKFIYLFHMPLFFLLSGYLFNEKKVNSLHKLLYFIKRKLKNLWVPYVIYNLFFLSCNNWFVNLGIYANEKLTIKQWFVKTLKIVCFLYEPQLGGALWFLRDLFLVNIVFGGVYFVLNQLKSTNKVKWLISTVVMLVAMCGGYWLGVKGDLFHGLAPAISAYSLMYLGFVLKKIKLSKIFENYFLIILSFVLLLTLSKFGSVELVANQYVNPLFLWVSVLAGWGLLYGIANKVKQIKSISNWLLVINKNAVCIMALHFLCFKIVTLAQIGIYKLPKYMLASFPTTEIEGEWWVIYSLVGILCPVFIMEFIVWIKNSMSKCNMAHHKRNRKSKKL